MAFLFPFTTVVYVLRFIYSPVFKRLQAFYFFVPSNENKCSKYDRSFPKCDECKMWFFVFNVNDEQRLDFTKTYNNSFRFHPFSMQHRIFTVYVYVFIYVYVYIILTVVAWLYFSACLGYSEARRIMYVLLFVGFIHTYIQVAHRKLFWTINKVNRRQKWVTCSSRHWMACANKAKGWFANVNAVQCSKLLCVSFLVEVVDCAPKNESDTNMNWTVLGHIDRLTPVSTAFTSNWIVWLTTDTLSAAT